MISVIMPAFNSAETIVEALESVTAQTLWEVRREMLDVRSEAMASHEAPSTGSGQADSFDKAQDGSGQAVKDAKEEYEVIIVDDCSTDNTVEVVRNWITSHASLSAGVPRRGTKEESLTPHSSRFTLHILPKNAGPAGARNAGIAAAKGEWIAFLDSDDAWLPWKLELQLAMAERYPGVALWGGGSRIIRGNAPVSQIMREGGAGSFSAVREVAENTVPVPISLDDLAFQNQIGTSKVLVKKKVIEAVGMFDERFRGPEDYDLWLRIVAGYQAMNIDAELIFYRERSGSLSMDGRKFLPQVLRVLDKAYGEGGVLEGRSGKRQACGYHSLSCAWMAAEQGAVFGAIVLLIRSLYYWPFPFRSINGVISWAHVKVAWRILKQARRQSGSVFSGGKHEADNAKAV